MVYKLAVMTLWPLGVVLTLCGEIMSKLVYSVLVFKEKKFLLVFSGSKIQSENKMEVRVEFPAAELNMRGG